MQKDYAIQIGSSNLRFGPGVTKEVGMDLADMGINRVLLITDPNLSDSNPVNNVREVLIREGIEFDVFDRVRVEPTDVSFKAAIDVAVAGKYGAFIAVGGGSTIDTAMAANLYATYPDDFFAYINAPIGQGKPIPGPVKPLIAIPTTAGTGSETTGVAIFDLTDRHVKTGIAHRYLKPVLGLVDPENTRTMPPVIAASSGLDVLCHALVSYTALPFYEIVAQEIIKVMQELDMPNGLSAVGFTEEDIPALVQGTLPQHRVTKLSPRPAEAEDLERLFRDAMHYW